MIGMRYYKRSLAGFSILSILALSLFAQTSKPRGVYLSYVEARPVLETLAEVLPAELKNKNSSELAVAWPTWISRHDAEIRARLALGDEDSLVNFLLFGTSYTTQPRITSKEIEQVAQAEREPTASKNEAILRVSKSLQARAEDLTQGLLTPGNNERLLFARRLIEQKGHDPRTAAGRARLKEYLLAGVGRVLNEQATYARTLAAARQLGDPTEEFAERSRLYRSRGLSSDTSLMPNYALEESLKALEDRGLIKAASVRRVAIVGPGLDFTDKHDGYDFYPQQTIQPFAIIDTLLRLGLARPDQLQLTTFDLSPRVNDHLERAKQRALSGVGYVVQLPRDPLADWKPPAVQYWANFGSSIGSPVTPIASPSTLNGLRVRAVRIRPNIVSRITPEDLNIVLQRPELAATDRFDLIIATNILVYYDVFEQSLALLNVEGMLRPGGFLLSNNALVELPFSRVHSVDYLTVVYSDRPDDGDHIIWYQRSPD
jgi:CheR methyltransferase, SAM binding domain